jgi:hypothetical protein
MRNPENKEGQIQPAVERKEDMMKIPSGLEDVASSVDEAQTPEPLVEEGEEIVAVSNMDPHHNYFSNDEIQKMSKGSIKDTGTWLGKILDRLKKKKAAEGVS